MQCVNPRSVWRVYSRKSDNARQQAIVAPSRSGSRRVMLRTRLKCLAHTLAVPCGNFAVAVLMGSHRDDLLAGLVADRHQDAVLAGTQIHQLLAAGSKCNDCAVVVGRRVQPHQVRATSRLGPEHAIAMIISVQYYLRRQEIVAKHRRRIANNSLAYDGVGVVKGSAHPLAEASVA